MEPRHRGPIMEVGKRMGRGPLGVGFRLPGADNADSKARNAPKPDCRWRRLKATYADAPCNQRRRTYPMDHSERQKTHGTP
jgi:hypothetical protein